MTDYSWFTNYVESDILWLDESLNWDETISTLVADNVPLLSATSSYWSETHLFTSYPVLRPRFLNLVMLELCDETQSAYFALAVFLDIATHNSAIDSFAEMFMHSDYQDWVSTLMYHSPELVIAIHDWSALVFSSNTYASSAVAVFDLFRDTPSFKIAEFVESCVLLMGYVWLSILSISVLRVQPIWVVLSPTLIRFYYYAASYAAESRLQLNAVIEASFLAFGFLLMAMMTFDDDREEIIEFLNLHLFYLFLLTFAMHAWKYSVHYFSFLDSSRANASSVVFIFSQFFFDLLNVGGFAVRFVLLMLRLNIYDTLDDVLESYYIFLTDFEEDENFLDTFPNGSSFAFFDTDVHDDRSFLQEDEADLVIDLYTIYSMLWGKFVLFVFFFLDEIFRVVLALYVTFTLMFEVNATNRSRSEDAYILNKRA